METPASVPPPLPTLPPPLPARSASAPSPAKKALHLLIGGTSALVAGLLMHQVTSNFFARHRTPAPATAAGAPVKDGWTHQNIAGLDFEAPAAQLVRNDVMRILPIDTQAKMIGMDAYLTQPPNPQFQVSVLRTTLKPEYPLDLNGAMRGALQNVAATARIANPDFKFDDAMLGDVPVKRGRFDGQKGKDEIHLEILGLQRGQTMWQVQVIFASEARRADAERVLKSIIPPPIQ